jgi:eukaryotic-like serine/threonine-protein kinase
MWKAEKPVHILLHLAIIAGIIFLIALFFFKIYLPFSTNHNEKIVVPVLTGKSIEEIEETLDDADLRFHINDSSYVEGQKPNMVLSQHPEAGSEVKKNRKIYITVTASQPPKVKMPKLVDQSLKGAELTLKSFDLRVGNVSYQASPFKDLVLAQTVNGQDIVPGTYIAKGSRIDVVVGNGEAGEEVEIPYLVGMTKDEAIKDLESKGLKPGIIATDLETSETSGNVSRQSPDPSEGEAKTIQKGSAVNLWIAE